MFTGLIQQVGRLAKIQNADGGARLQIHAAWPAPLAPGESTDVVYRYAVSDDFKRSARLLRKYEEPATVDQAVERSRGRWDRALEAAQMQSGAGGALPHMP